MPKSGFLSLSEIEHFIVITLALLGVIELFSRRVGAAMRVIVEEYYDIRKFWLNKKT